MADSILNEKGRIHCRFYMTRPVKLDAMVLCSGRGHWEPCPDLAKCRCIPPPKTTSQKSKAPPRFYEAWTTRVD